MDDHRSSASSQGLVTGLLYGLLALGLVLLYRTNRVLNFAQGQLGVVAAVFLLKLTRDLEHPYWPSLLVVLVLAAALGALCELLLRRLFNRPRVLVMVATIGLSQVLFLLHGAPVRRAEGPLRPVPGAVRLDAARRRRDPPARRGARR